MIADFALDGRRDMTTGANQDDFHLRGVDVERDIAVKHWLDLREVRAGEGCPSCGEPLRVVKTIEVGHIFKLGTRYSEALGATVLDESGKARADHHGLVRDRHRAHDGGGGRALPRRERHRLADGDRALRGGRDAA